MDNNQHQYFLQAKKIAKIRKGQCLSKNYINSKIKLKWRCSKNHVWEASFSEIKGTSKRKGTWCPFCYNRVDKKFELKSCVKGKGIKSLSSKYTLSSAKYKWNCNKCQHIWFATHNNIKRGKGCPVCAQKRRKESQRKYSIDDLKKCAQNCEGKCLTKQYLGYHKHHRFKCHCGYEWEAIAETILRRNTWCPRCSGMIVTINDAVLLAKARGGEFIDNNFISSKAKHNWICVNKHEFRMGYSTVKAGQWCSECSKGFGEKICRQIFEKTFNEKFPSVWPDWLSYKNGRNLELDGYCEKLALAFEHHGRQHYRKIGFFSTRSFDEQKKVDVFKRRICKKKGITLIEVPEIPALLKIDDIKSFLEKVFREKGIKVPKRFQEIKHDFAAIYSEKIIEKYLPYLEARKITLQEDYKGWSEKHLFRCNVCAYEWKALASNVLNIKNPRGCPKCGRRRIGEILMKGSVKEFQILAKNRRGKLLSKEWKGVAAKYLWECENKHTWPATARAVKGYSGKKGTWCRKCAK